MSELILERLDVLGIQGFGDDPYQTDFLNNIEELRKKGFKRNDTKRYDNPA